MAKPIPLPDCKLTGPLHPAQITALGWSVPIYCANCGREGGWVPEAACDFAFYLCTPCLDTHGAQTLGMVVPDHEFYENLKHEQLEAYHRFLTPDELVEIVAADMTPLATLIKAHHTP